MQKYIRTNYDINFQHDSLRHQVLVYQPRAFSNRISSEVFGVLIKFQDRWNSSLVPDLNRWLCCVPPLSPACCLGGSVNTGFRLGLLSIVRTTGHVRAEMLNVSARSISLLRKGNRTFPSNFFVAGCFTITIDYCSTNSFLMCSSFVAERRKKKVKIRSLQSVTTFVCSVILWESPNATVLSLHLSRNIELWPSLEVLPCLFTHFWQNKPLFILAVTIYLSSRGDMKAAARRAPLYCLTDCHVQHHTQVWS